MQQKHIKVAGYSKYGWNTVHYYQSNPFALDSEEEKELHAQSWKKYQEQARNQTFS